MAVPGQVDVWVGLDVGKQEHFADVLDDRGERLFSPAYGPALVMRRAADPYPGEAKTGRRDAYVIADTGRTRREQVHYPARQSPPLGLANAA